MPTPILNDSTVQYASRVLTINSVTYVAENISITRSTGEIIRRDEEGRINGRVLYKDDTKGTATLQLASGSTAIPLRGRTFTETWDSVTGSETFCISEMSQPEEQSGEKKVNISFVKVFGGSPVTNVG